MEPDVTAGQLATAAQITQLTAERDAAVQELRRLKERGRQFQESARRILMTRELSAMFQYAKRMQIEVIEGLFDTAWFDTEGSAYLRGRREERRDVLALLNREQRCCTVLNAVKLALSQGLHVKGVLRVEEG